MPTRKIVTALLCLLAWSTSSARADSTQSTVTTETTITSLDITPNKVIAAGIELQKQGRYNEAVQQFQASYTKNDQPDLACFLMSDCFARQGNLPKAKQYLEFVCKNWPNSTVVPAAQAVLKTITAATSPPALTKTYAPFQRTGQGHMIVSALINGHQTPMIFDTGAGACFATTSQLTQAGITINASGHGGRAQGMGGEIQVSTAEVTIQVGGLSRRVILCVQDDEVQMRTQGHRSVAGYPLLGQNFFGDVAVEIDGPNQQIAFSTALDKVPQGVENTAYRLDGAHLIVTPKVNSRECEMILDTGASAVTFSDAQFSGFGFSRPTNADRSMSLGVGGLRQAYSFYLDTVELGPIKHKGVQAMLGINGGVKYPLLGASFLRDAHFTIEPKIKRLLFY
ncbi:MAG TPA: retroviral-like aspartic protease family protein [Planktothrix sp.]